MNFDFYGAGLGFIAGVFASYLVSDLVFAYWFKKKDWLLDKGTVEIFCKVAKKLCHAKTFADKDSKASIDEALELMANHCSCTVEKLIRNKVDEILIVNDKA